jgi:hypothetical protein
MKVYTSGASVPHPTTVGLHGQLWAAQSTGIETQTLVRGYE